MGEKAGEASEQALASRSAPAAPVQAPQDQDGKPLAQVDVTIDPSTGKASLKFIYICFHCGAPRETDSGRYSGACATCGQSAARGNEQLDAVARGEHIPTFDRTSPFYP
jgi:hypothetical protein